MATVELRTSEGVRLHLEVAGAGTRFAAALLDALLVVPSILAVLLLLTLAAGVDPTGVSAFVRGLFALGLLLVLVAYHVGFQAATLGRSPGKSALGIRVVASDGQPADLSALVLRGLVGILDGLLLVPVPLGLVVIAVSEKRQRLGDMVAGTLVVREPRLAAALEPWPRDRWSALPQRTLPLAAGHAARFEPADLDFLRAVITRPGLSAERRRSLYERVVRHYARRLGIAELSADPRAVLKELYLFLRETRGAGA